MRVKKSKLSDADRIVVLELDNERLRKENLEWRDAFDSVKTHLERVRMAQQQMFDKITDPKSGVDRIQITRL